MSDPVAVSVVICTYNRAEFLREALASIKALANDGTFTYEIVVIDNASTDQTSRVIEEAAQGSPVPLRGAYEANPGIAQARNRGIRETRNEWIAFFDDDQVADPQWLIELLGMARAKNVRCVGGGNRLRLPPGEPDDLGPEMCGVLGGGARETDLPQRYDRNASPATNNLLLYRGVLDEIGGFDESTRDGGEDTDLFRRMHAAGIAGWYNPRAFSFHIVPPYRLKDAYIRWKCLRNGGHIARRNWRDQGRVFYLLVLLARIGQAGCLHLPRLWWARLRRSPRQVRDMQCRLWRSEGYIRYALSFLAPRLFAQRAFFAGLDFRSERELFAEAKDEG